MYKILVTGASGLLGTSLVPYLIECGQTVFALSRATGTDLVNSEQAIAVFEKINPDIIVNLAALTNVDECEIKPHLAYLMNVKIVENITKWIKLERKCHLIQISTDQVYDGDVAHKEDGITLTNYYGFSKYAGELATSDITSCILRTNFFGVSKNKHRNSFSDWIVKELLKERKITVFDDVKFSPLSITNLVKFILLAINKKKNGIFNLGAVDSMSKATFAFAFAEELGLSTKYITRGCIKDVKLSAPRPKNMSMDSSFFATTFEVNLPSLTEEILNVSREYKNAIK